MRSADTGMYVAETEEGIRRLLEAAMRTEAPVTVSFKPGAVPTAGKTIAMSRVRPSKSRPLTRFCGTLEGHDSLENRLAGESGFPIDAVLTVATFSFATWEESLVADGGDAAARVARTPVSSLVTWCRNALG